MYPELRKCVPPVVYLKDHRTLSLKGPRGTGHTTAAAKLSVELIGSVVITNSCASSRFFLRQFKVNAIPEFDLSRTQIPRNAEIVILDSVSDFKLEQIDRIYAHFADYKEIFFILLG